MMLDLAGGAMNPGPSWALSIEELERLGFTDAEARRFAGVSPTFALDGWWLVLIDDEPYDPKQARVIEIRGDQAISNKGEIGTVMRAPKKALVRFDGPDGSECITISAAQSEDLLMGMTYVGSQLPEGDPAASPLEEEDIDPEDDRPLAMVAWLYRQGTAEDILAGLEARVAAMDPSEKIGEWGPRGVPIL